MKKNSVQEKAPKYHKTDRPRYRTHCNGITAHEQIRTDNDSLSDMLVACDDPDTAAIDNTPFSKVPLKTSDETKPETHEESTDEKHGPTPPRVDFHDGRNR